MASKVYDFRAQVVLTTSFVEVSLGRECDTQYLEHVSGDSTVVVSFDGGTTEHKHIAPSRAIEWSDHPRSSVHLKRTGGSAATVEVCATIDAGEE